MHTLSHRTRGYRLQFDKEKGEVIQEGDWQAGREATGTTQDAL